MNFLKITQFLKPVKIHIKWNSQSLSITTCSKLSQNKKHWNKTVNAAEKIVGYPTSFLSLRWLLSDEVSNVVLHLRKIIGTTHPLLKTVKALLHNGKNNIQLWGLIVLLVSKAAGQPLYIRDLEEEQAAGVLHSQRKLAEVTEMIKTSHIVHKSLMNIKSSIGENERNMIYGNKIALLSGDYLLSNCYLRLSELRDQELIELMSSALRDQSEAEFVGPRDNNNNPLPARPNSRKKYSDTIGFSTTDPIIIEETLGNAEAEWTMRHVLSGGSLLGKSCKSALKLAGHTLQFQDHGYSFGKYIALAWQAQLDRELFQSEYTGPFSLISAPVMFQLEHDPSLYEEIEKGMKDIFDINYKTIHESVVTGPGLERARLFQNELSENAIGVLQQFPQSDARTALTNLANSLNIQ